MQSAISNTSPLLYLYRSELISLLPEIFSEVQITKAVCDELMQGAELGYDVPIPEKYGWLEVVESPVAPSEWLNVELDKGELTTIILALTYPDFIILLDDQLARKKAQASGLNVWGTLKVILELKSLGVLKNVKPALEKLTDTGMWISPQVKHRILILAGEN